MAGLVKLQGLALLWALICIGPPTWIESASAGDKVSLLVIARDADRDANARDTPVFQVAYSTFQAKLSAPPYRVHDADIVFHRVLIAARTSLSKVEILELLKTRRDLELGYVASLSVYSGAKRDPFSGMSRLTVNLVAQLFDVGTGVDLPEQRVALDQALERDCLDRRCLILVAKALASKAAAALANKVRATIETARAGKG